MKTWFSTVTGYPGARSKFLVGLACIAFVFGFTISLSFAGFQDGGVHGSRFVGPVQRIGFTAPHDSDAVYNPYLSRYRGGTMGYEGLLQLPSRSPAYSSCLTKANVRLFLELTESKWSP